MSIETGEGKKGRERLEVEIGPARPEDARDIAELLYLSWRETYPNEQFGVTLRAIKDYWAPEFENDQVQARAERIRTASERFSMLVARVDGKIIGFARVTRLESENYLGALYLHPEYIGKGVGMALWNRVHETLDPKRDTTLTVAPYNERAKSFYESLGFVLENKPMAPEDGLELPGGAVIPQQRMRRPADIQSES